MDAEFLVRLEQARRIEVSVGAARYTLRLPSDHAWRLALEANRDAHGRVLEAKAFRAVLDEAIVGWDGVRTTDILPDAADGPLAFSKEARALLLEHRQDVADELTVAIGSRLTERRARREEARKNSGGASSGT